LSLIIFFFFFFFLFLDFYLGALELTLSLLDSTHSAQWTDGRRISLSLPCVPEQITSISAFFSFFSSIDAQMNFNKVGGPRFRRDSFAPVCFFKSKS
jgi:hypothetical protein